MILNCSLEGPHNPVQFKSLDYCQGSAKSYQFLFHWLLISCLKRANILRSIGTLHVRRSSVKDFFFFFFLLSVANRAPSDTEAG